MKQIRHILFSIMVLLLFSACENTTTGQENLTGSQTSSWEFAADTSETQTALFDEPTEINVPDESEKILIAYFSWADNAEQDDVDAVASASVNAPGNVAQMALCIQQEIGGDLFPIKVKEPYPSDYDECLDRAADEKAENSRPELTERITNMTDYDTVLLGFPNWCYTAPMAVFSFIEENDLSGKKVVLFCSHGTGGLASCVRDITSALPNSTVESNVIGIYRDDVTSSQDKIRKWLNEIGF